MKTRKGLICLLAGLMTVSMAFSACDAQEIYNSVIQSSQTESSEDSSEQENAESSLESSEIESSEIVESVESVESPESSEETSEEESSSEGDKNYVDDEALAILQAAIEKSLLYQNNYTEETFQMVTEFDITDNGDVTTEYYEHTYINKYDVDKAEGKGKTVHYVGPGTSYDHWEFRQLTSEEGGVTYNQNSEGEWYQSGTFTGGLQGSVDESEFQFIKSFFDGLKGKDIVQYDAETQTFTIKDYVVEMPDGYFGGEGKVSGTAVTIYHTMIVQLKDGYVYKEYVDTEMRVDAVLKYDGEERVVREGVKGIVEFTITNWGTTVVTLPTIAEN